jgi:hypothetical protein
MARTGPPVPLTICRKKSVHSKSIKT